MPDQPSQKNNRAFFALMSRGTTRMVFCIGSLAVKVPKNYVGLKANLREVKIWNVVDTHRRLMACPVRFSLPFGLATIMSRATPLTELQMNLLREEREFPDWNYQGGADISEPTEEKCSDWGYLEDRLVALDYGGLG